MVERPPPSWKPPTLTCLIAASPRSGSNLLCGLMRSTGRMGRPEEYFSPFASRLLYQEAPDARHGFDLVGRLGIDSNGVATVKLFPDHLELIESQFRWPDWFPKVSWIWLTRNDLLGQAISEAIAQQTGAWWSGAEPSRDPSYSKQGIEDALLRVAEIDSRWRVYFACNAIKPFHVAYEDLESSPGATIARIAEFLGIPMGDTPASPLWFERQRNQINDEWRRRYLAEASPVRVNLRRPVARTFRNLRRFLSGRLRL